MSALITAEWYMRKNHFPGWARPFEFNAQLYDSIGRHEEARDGVRAAASPWPISLPRLFITHPFGMKLIYGAACGWPPPPAPCKQQHIPVVLAAQQELCHASSSAMLDR